MKPHVPVVVDDADEGEQLFAVPRLGDIHHCRDLVLHWLDTVSGDPVAKVLELCSGEEQFLGVDLQASVAKALKDSLEFVEVVSEVALSKTEKIVYVHSGIVESCEKLVHLFLEDVGRVAQTHRGSLVFKFAEGKHDGAWFLGLVV